MENIEENFKSETKTIKFLFRALFFFLHLAIMTEFVATPKFRIGLRLAFFLWFAIPYIKTIKSRYYTYWTFSVALLFYMLYKIYEQYLFAGNPHIALLYSMAVFILLIKMYMLYSPIYYPRVSWWEYDFRYKDDLKIKVNYLEHIYEARLTDLRRQAGCVALFEELKLGDEVIINATSGEDINILRGIVMSKRKDIIGRPIIYGVGFKFDNRRNKRRYQNLVKMWKKEKNNKMKMKFANV